MTPPDRPDRPTEPVYLDHLEAMAIAMVLLAERDAHGLSQPQESALAKVHAALRPLLAPLRRR